VINVRGRGGHRRTQWTATTTRWSWMDRKGIAGKCWERKGLKGSTYVQQKNAAHLREDVPFKLFFSMHRSIRTRFGSFLVVLLLRFGRHPHKVERAVSGPRYFHRACTSSRLIPQRKFYRIGPPRGSAQCPVIAGSLEQSMRGRLSRAPDETRASSN
jgi:hypothetical protein